MVCGTGPEGPWPPVPATLSQVLSILSRVRGSTAAPVFSESSLAWASGAVGSEEAATGGPLPAGLLLGEEQRMGRMSP